jgi:UDP-N-acetyl-D-glucosamine dehydrogenase
MPEYVSLRVAELLHGRGIAMHGARILVIGATYKKDIKDLRKSPSLDLIGILQKKGAKVSYYDPLVPYLKLNHVINLRSVELKKEILKASDCAVIATDHSGVDYDFLLRNSKLVFDTRNVYKGVNDRKAALL